jgi:Tfp pilus assembly protein PilO
MSSRDRSLIALVVLVIVAIGGYFLIVQPEHSKANKVEAKISSAHSDLLQAEQTVQQGELADAQYKSYSKQFKSITAAVPGDTQIPELINELQSASDRTKVTFQAVSVAGVPTTPTAPATGTAAITFPSQSFTLSFTGSYFAVANLLGQLANFVHADDKNFHATGRLLSISSVSESSGGSASPTTNGTATPTGTATAAAGSGQVTASVDALDYDVPASASGSSAAASSATPSSTS